MTIRYLMMSLLLLAGIGTEGQTLEDAFRNPTAETGSVKESFSDDFTDTIPVAGTWTVGFDEGRVVEWPSLMPWNESADCNIKYFSGTATPHEAQGSRLV